MTSDGVVVDEAVRAAWDSYRILENSTSSEERRQAQQWVQAAMDTYGQEEVSRCAVFLVGALTATSSADRARSKRRTVSIR
ncbi:hypothetical protein [Streptomyces sp. NPDC017964]|uniref:hypothetical protein n=1 Tax=Streptomyces sp. NPDC017964 TaxID=3365022 RepID=UPI00379B46E4